MFSLDKLVAVEGRKISALDTTVSLVGPFLGALLPWRRLWNSSVSWTGLVSRKFARLSNAHFPGGFFQLLEKLVF